MFGNFLENDFWTNPLPPHNINFVHASHIEHMNKAGHVAAAPGTLACPSRSARRKSVFTEPFLYTEIVKTDKWIQNW